MKIVVFGASGKTGRLVVEELLAAGHQVRAFVRTPTKLPLKHNRLELFQGDLSDAARIDQAVAGMDAVVSTAGQTKTSAKDLLTVAAQHITAAMKKHGVKRIVTLTGAGVFAETDGAPTFGRRFMRGLMQLLVPHVISDSQTHHQLISTSGLEWTNVRPPRLIDGAKKGNVKAAPYLPLGPSAQITRADLAAFMAARVADGQFVGQAPMVSA